MEPKLNKQGGKLEKVTEYFQDIPDDSCTLKGFEGRD